MEKHSALINTGKIMFANNLLWLRPLILFTEFRPFLASM